MRLCTVSSDIAGFARVCVACVCLVRSHLNYRSNCTRICQIQLFCSQVCREDGVPVDGVVGSTARHFTRFILTRTVERCQTKTANSAPMAANICHTSDRQVINYNSNRSKVAATWLAQNGYPFDRVTEEQCVLFKFECCF